MSSTPGSSARYTAEGVHGTSPAELEAMAFSRASKFFGVPAGSLEVAEPYSTDQRGAVTYAAILVRLARSS